MRISRCQGCGRPAFEARGACPSCGGSAWTDLEVREGVVLTATTLHATPPGFDPTIHLAYLEAQGGHLLVRLDQPAEAGDSVLLEGDEPQGRISRRATGGARDGKPVA